MFKQLPCLAELGDAEIATAGRVVGQAARTEDGVLEGLAGVKVDFGVELGLHVCVETGIERTLGPAERSGEECVQNNKRGRGHRDEKDKEERQAQAG